MNSRVLVVLAICFLTMTVSCKSSRPSTVKASSATDPAITGRQWRLEKESVAADSREDYEAGIEALRTLDAFGTMEVSKLFYHHQLIMVPAGTLVAEVDPGARIPSTAPAVASSQSGVRIRVLDGPESGKTLWLFPESAEKMGFDPPKSTH